MGHGIAVALAQAGHLVAVHDVDPETMASLDQRIGRALERCGHPGQGVEHMRRRVTGAASLSELAAETDVVIEAVPERLDVKHDVLNAVEAQVGQHIPIWTNTSVLPITEVAGRMAHPERLVGVHWWNPPYIIPLVEIAPGAATGEPFVRDAHERLTELGKSTVRLNRNVPGFVGNRLQFALVREALHLVDQGVCDPETIDTVVRRSIGLRWAAVGPMENAGYIGLGLTRDILRSLAPHLSTETHRFPGLDKPLSETRTGRLSGNGLLEWPPDRVEEIAERLEAGIRRNLAHR